EVSCGAGGALRVRPAAESEWLTCGAGSRVSACGKYADLCRQRIARTAATKRIKTAITADDEGENPAVKHYAGYGTWEDFLATADNNRKCENGTGKTSSGIDCWAWNTYGKENITSPAPAHENSANARLTSEHPETVSEVLRPPVPGKREGAMIENERQLPGSNTEERKGTAASDRTVLPTPTVTNTQSQTPGTTPGTQGDQGASGNTTANSTPVTSTPTQQSPESANQSHENGDVTAASDSHETNSTTPQSPESNVSEALTTTPSPVPVPNSDINTIAPTVLKKTNTDSSVSPVWMRTVAPLLIVAVLFSATVY
ncbi:uncharacterized protein TM35_000471650, partial [Trypanosoma theileri]